MQEQINYHISFENYRLKSYEKGITLECDLCKILI